MKSDEHIAREAHLQPIETIAEPLGLSRENLYLYGPYKAKVPLELRAQLEHSGAEDGKLILVTAMTPTPMGEGKTTNTIGLAQALKQIGASPMAAIREPSLGPCMGVKGGAAGGGYSQVLPMDEINLHFTGDLHAVSIAHNLLSALIDNHMHQNKEPVIHPRKVEWKRVMDMNDRSLREILVGLGGNGINGVAREDGFEITAASEVMAVLCLARDLNDLKRRLGNIIVGVTPDRKPVTAADLHVQGAMAALLKQAMNPNLVQSIEGVPVFIHGGPFANIAHGCNSIAATQIALKLSDYLVTEAGFASELGAEKFFNIKCRTAGLAPRAVVIVVTLRAVKLHGIDNVKKHVENIRMYQVPVIVSINKFLDDDPAELESIQAQLREEGIPAEITDFRESGGNGGLNLAEEVVKMCDEPSAFAPLYPLDMSIRDKISTICTKMYGAGGVVYEKGVITKIKRLEQLGYGGFPICMAKTQTSLSDNPKVKGRPADFEISVKDVKVRGGAEFIVVFTGDIMTMPGLPEYPAAENIDINEAGDITGLF